MFNAGPGTTARNTMTSSAGLMILLFSAYYSVDGSSSFSQVRTEAAIANVTETTQLMDCEENEDYHDIRTLSFLRFSAMRIARRKHHLVGDNVQLQCQDPNTCAFSGYPGEASCYNSQVDQLLNPVWDCQTTFPDRRYTFGSIRVSCEILSETMNYCVLKNSCILFYIPSKEASLLLGFALTTMSMSSFFCLLAVVCSVRRHRTDSGPAVSISSQTSIDHRTYDPAADLPPSYSFVLRNPQCFDKPNRTSSRVSEPTNIAKERALSESPPPSYETCSGEE